MLITHPMLLSKISNQHKYKSQYGPLHPLFMTFYIPKCLIDFIAYNFKNDYMTMIISGGCRLQHGYRVQEDKWSLYLFLPSLFQRVMMQIVQELCKRPGLNKCGFDMPTIYIPNPNKVGPVLGLSSVTSMAQ